MKTTEQQLIIVNIEEKDVNQIYNVFSNPDIDQCLFSILLYADDKKSVGLDLDKRYSYKNRDKIYLQMYCSDGAGKVIASINSKIEPSIPEVRLVEALDQLINSNRQFFDKVSKTFGYEFLFKITANINSDETIADQNDINNLFDGG